MSSEIASVAWCGVRGRKDEKGTDLEWWGHVVVASVMASVVSALAPLAMALSATSSGLTAAVSSGMVLAV